MNTPRGVRWLEQQTGERLERADDAPKLRHVSVRVPIDLYSELERIAVGREESVSHTVRRILAAAVEGAESPTTAIDDAITALQQARNRLTA